ncbi:MAG: DUF2087 domain-containing protein [Ruminococcaceae bacterium]|nr:DUF2087 domain-containing protein [Oscillospiraceae bacterium]
MENRLEILKLLADETRLGIINALMEEDSYVEKLASTLGLTPATICYHLKKMEAAGIVGSSRTQFYIIYSLNRDIFDLTLREFIKQDKPVEDPDEKYRREVLSNFFKYGKLTRIPVQQKKREIVLRHIAKDLSAGKDYTEKEVNEVILKYHEDYCTIRREMIGFGIMDRTGGIYRLKE